MFVPCGQRWLRFARAAAHLHLGKRPDKTGEKVKTTPHPGTVPVPVPVPVADGRTDNVACDKSRANGWLACRCRCRCRAPPPSSPPYFILLARCLASFRLGWTTRNTLEKREAGSMPPALPPVAGGLGDNGEAC